MRIYLVGMPGSGKSTLGKTLANKLHYTFIDLDERIVEAEGTPISTIFSNKGEEYFRKLESKSLQDTSIEDNVVVATGGGAPCFHNNMDLINKMGISVWLDIPVTQLAQRVLPGNDNKQIRPLFAGKSKHEIIDTLEVMRQKRSPFYQQAHITLSMKEASLEKAIKKIEAFLSSTKL